MRQKAAKPASKSSLPSYKKPPVSEVVCGLRFEPLGELKIPHIGLLWDKFRQDYPKLEHAAPIASENGILVDASTGAPIPRVWFISAEDNQLVQFQGDRYHFNWRQRDDEYPRYSKIIERFESAKATLDAFLNEFNLGTLKPIEYELTYINHIAKGQGWETTEDLHRVFTDFNWVKRKGRFLPTPANLSWQTRFPLTDDKGWLTTKLRQGTRLKDQCPLFVLELLARGMGPDMRQWFNLAHEWIVRGFTDLTTPQIQSATWEREDDTAG